MSLISQDAPHHVPSLSCSVAHREKAQGHRASQLFFMSSQTLACTLNKEGKYLGTHHPWELELLKGGQELSKGMLSFRNLLLSKCKRLVNTLDLKQSTLLPFWACSAPSPPIQTVQPSVQGYP